MLFPPPPASISQRVFMSFYVCRSYSSTSKVFCLPSEKDLSNLCSICLFVSKFVLLPQWFAIEGEAHAVVLAFLVVVNHVLEASVLHEGHPLRRLTRLIQRLAALHHAPLPVLHAVLPQGLHVQPLLVGVELLVIFHHIAINKNTRQLEIQRLPRMNAAKIGIISESCKYFAMYFCFLCALV